MLVFEGWIDCGQVDIWPLGQIDSVQLGRLAKNPASEETDYERSC